MIIKVDVYTEVSELDEAARERMWTKSKQQFTASIECMHGSNYGGNVKGIKGCPLGRSFESRYWAIQDLRVRVELESNVTLEVMDIENR